VRKELIALVKAGTDSLHIKSAAELIREAADAQIAIATAVASATSNPAGPTVLLLGMQSLSNEVLRVVLAFEALSVQFLRSFHDFLDAILYPL
jgi:hypothetical protein